MEAVEGEDEVEERREGRSAGVVSTLSMGGGPGGTMGGPSGSEMGMGSRKDGALAATGGAGLYGPGGGA